MYVPIFYEYSILVFNESRVLKPAFSFAVQEIRDAHEHRKTWQWQTVIIPGRDLDRVKHLQHFPGLCNYLYVEVQI